MAYEITVKLTCEEENCDNQIIEKGWGLNFDGVIKKIKHRFQRQGISLNDALCKKHKILVDVEKKLDK